MATKGKIFSIHPQDKESEECWDHIDHNMTATESYGSTGSFRNSLNSQALW